MARASRFLAVLAAALAAPFFSTMPLASCAGASSEVLPPQPGAVPVRDESVMIDLTDAIVVAPAGLSRTETKAVAVLVDEVATRTGRRWDVRDRWPDERHPVVAVGRGANLPEQAARLLGGAGGRQSKAEAFRVRDQSCDDRAVVVAGDDARGCCSASDGCCAAPE